MLEALFRTVIVLIVVGVVGVGIVVTGCTGQDAMTGPHNMKTQCLNGVTYYIFHEYSGYQGYGYMSPKYNRDGTVELCGPQ